MISQIKSEKQAAELELFYFSSFLYFILFHLLKNFALPCIPTCEHILGCLWYELGPGGSRAFSSFTRLSLI